MPLRPTKYQESRCLKFCIKPEPRSNNKFLAKEPNLYFCQNNNKSESMFFVLANQNKLKFL